MEEIYVFLLYEKLNILVLGVFLTIGMENLKMKWTRCKRSKYLALFSERYVINLIKYAPTINGIKKIFCTQEIYRLYFIYSIIFGVNFDDFARKFFDCDLLRIRNNIRKHGKIFYNKKKLFLYKQK